MKKNYLYFMAALLLTLCVSCSKSISKKDLTGEWRTIGIEDYIFYEDGTGNVTGLTRAHEITWELVGDSLFIKEVGEGGIYDGAFHIDSLKTEVFQDKKADILYLSYIGKKNILYASLYKGYGFNFNDGPNEYFYSEVAKGFLTTENGYCWLLTENGLYWLSTEEGKQWLASEEGQAYIDYRDATEIRQTQWGREK